MITDPSGTLSFPNFTSPDDAYTLDDAYAEAQDALWTTLFGALISWALFGSLCIQFYNYMRNFPNDRKVIRSTVLLLFIVEIGATCFLTWTTYMTVVVQWGHMPYYDAGTWGSMLFDCTVASIVHALYGWRIYRLITRRWIAIPCVLLIALLSMAQFSCCTAAALFNGLQYVQGPGKQYIARKLFHGWVACATCADVIITGIMAFKLHSVRTGVKSTDRTIDRIMYVTVPGGAATAIMTLAILIIQLTHTGSNYYQFLIISLTKIYSNSVLLCLNLRTLNRSHNSTMRRETFISMPKTNGGDASRLGLCDVKIQRDVEKTSTVALNDLESANQTMTAIEPSTPAHKYCSDGKNWQQSSMMTQSSLDEVYVTSRGPILTTAHATLPIVSYEHPFSSSVSSQSNTLSSPKSKFSAL